MYPVRLRNLLQALVVRRLARNASTLFGANMVSSLLGLLAFSLVARALGPETFGVFALVLAYVFVFDTLANFQSWQALIKYGAEHLRADRSSGFVALVKFGTALDVGCASVGALLAMILAPLLVPLFGNGADVTLFVAYSVAIMSRITGTPTAILRLFDRFDILGMQQICIGVTRVCLVSVAFICGSSLTSFLLAWVVAEIVGNAFLFACAWRELYRRGYRGVVASSIRNALRENQGLWSFIWTTNLHGSLKLGLREADVLVLGALVGPKAAGLYKVVKQAESVASRTYTPLTQAIYPELAKAASQGDRHTLLKLLGLASAFGVIVFGAMWLAFCIFGERLIGLILGEGFAPAYVPGLVYLFGAMISAATFGLQPAALALGMPQRSLRVLLASTTVYAVGFGFLVFHFKLLGAAVSYVLFYIIWSTLMVRLVWGGIKKLPGVLAESAHSSVGSNESQGNAG